jgi:hypothetical protein
LAFPEIALASKFKGLCVVCEMAETCTFPRNPDEPVLQCEEWRCVVLDYAGHGFVLRSATDAERVPTGRAEDNEWEQRGLCVTCGRSAICKLPKPEEGIWHCVEYQLIL